jgi:hypothetical protein
MTIKFPSELKISCNGSWVKTIFLLPHATALNIVQRFVDEPENTDVECGGMFVSGQCWFASLEIFLYEGAKAGRENACLS